MKVTEQSIRNAFKARLESWWGTETVPGIEGLVDELMHDIGYARTPGLAKRDPVAFAISRRIYHREYKRQQRKDQAEMAAAYEEQNTPE